MGKKSRLKRERRAHATGKAMFGAGSMRPSPHDAKFGQQWEALRGLFTQFAPVDVVVSLSVSELWRPNRSSQVKHHLALSVALATPVSEFAAEKRIDTFEQFSAFTAELRRLFPAFPSLEDFVPEADWGEVRVEGVEGFVPIYYGGSVERIPDFIEAFRLLRADEPQALADMQAAIAIQSHLIRSIDTGLVGDDGRVAAGHIETPAAHFWAACRAAMLSTCSALRGTFDEVSGELTGRELGSVTPPKGVAEFEDAVLTGALLPLLAVKVGETHLPISPRSAVSVVVDFWASRRRSRSANSELDLNRRVGQFLSWRLRQRDLVPGPMRLPLNITGFSGCVAAAVMSDGGIYLVVLVDPEDLPVLEQLEKELKGLADRPQRWGLLLPDARRVLEFRRRDGSRPNSENIGVVAVLSRVVTTASALPVPGKSVRVMSLPDFVSIFDSLHDAAELQRFWTYVDGLEPYIGGMSGIADHFASFRDTHALLIYGAMQPDYISLDPHWSSGWRFKTLAAFWAIAPRHFPDGRATWFVDEKRDGLTALRAKGPPALAWSGSAGACTVQAVLEVSDDVDVTNGRLLELFVHCLADAVTQRRTLLAEIEPFQRPHLVLQCLAEPTSLVEQDDAGPTLSVASLPLLGNWRLGPSSRAEGLVVSTTVNLARLKARLESATDASFEVECVQETVKGICSLLGLPRDEPVIAQVGETASRPPRFTIHTTRRKIDVPDFADPLLPQPEHFKLARRDLALVLKDLGVAAPSRHELEPAKLIMNSARVAFRDKIHARIANVKRRELLCFCVEQHDQVTAKLQHEVARLELSLGHEVSFDRAELLAKTQEELTTASRNYRYLLECCLSGASEGNEVVTPAAVAQLLADIDWLSVLYGASDTLHNDLDVGGVELDEHFVPEVFFSEGRDEQERRYREEVARSKLGIGLDEDDEVTADGSVDVSLAAVDEALTTDAGFSLTRLVQALEVLTRWHAAEGHSELSFSYRATPTAIASKLVERLPEMREDTAQRIIQFLTLDPAGVRRLAGKPVGEPDVPVWEHFKRVHRYTIRPLVKVDADLLAWGAATANRTSSIWTGCILNGYLPADLGWPNVARVVRDIKAGLEAQLEVRAHEVCSRATPYALHGIDFKCRFPTEGFDDVGDFDVLAYWPEHSLWLAAECKYNQPPFCLKDGRRLRERIFGVGDDRGQFQKIERRRAFLEANVSKLRRLLDWPAHGAQIPLQYMEVYVSRDIYWWMRNPPYAVPTHFVRVDALDGWLRNQLDSRAALPGNATMTNPA
jgi:hypothetical protein